MLIVWIAMACCAPDDQGGRKANSLEFAYTYFAADRWMPEICEKISPEAYLAAARGGRGYQISYTRSECYYNLALEARYAEYCTHVVPKPSRFLDGRAMTEEACRAEVAKGSGLNSVGGDYTLVARFLGLTDAEVDRWSTRPGMAAIYWNDAALEFLSTPEARERAASLPDFARPGPAVSDDFAKSMLNCPSADDTRWFCQMAECLRKASHAYRDACMIVAEAIKSLQEVDGLEGYAASGDVLSAIERYPGLRSPYESAKRDSPRVRKEAREALAAAKAAVEEEQTRRSRVTFRQIDTDGDGSLSLGEFAGTANRHFEETSGIEAWDRSYRALDEDGDGAVTSAQFLAAKPDGRREFDWADRDHDGQVQIAELVSAYSANNARDAALKFDSRDIDDDGQLSVREFDDDRFVRSARMEELRRREQDAGKEARD